VFLGGDQPGKGAFDVLWVWSALQMAGFSGRLHWFGHIGEDLRADVARLPDTDRVLLHGRRSRREIFETAARSRVVLMLSRVEPFGMATIECMGMGCLAAAWDIDTGTREIVNADECTLAPLGDYDCLALGILNLLAVHESRYRAATRRIRTTFDDEAMWHRYKNVITWMYSRTPVGRPLSRSAVPPFRAPIRCFQFVPPGLRRSIRNYIGRSPRLGYRLRDLRGR
jgi:glycosyltransferase involved in cell wall biosynthesis